MPVVYWSTYEKEIYSVGTFASSRVVSDRDTPASPVIPRKQWLPITVAMEIRLLSMEGVRTTSGVTPQYSKP